MPNFTNQHFAVNFRPATLNIWNKGLANERWAIILYHIDPNSGKLKRWAMKLNRIKNKQERRCYAKSMVYEINHLLRSGWNPFIHGSPLKQQKIVSIYDGWKEYATYFQKELIDKGKREQKTLTDYHSKFKNFYSWLQHRLGKNEVSCFLVSKLLVREYLRYLEDNRRLSDKTINNYHDFIKSFADFLISEDIMTVNPTIGVRRKIEPPRKAPVKFTDQEIYMIVEHLEDKHQYFTLIFLLVYCCQLRNNEIAQLRLSNILLKEQVIHLRGRMGKNKKEQAITIPNSLMPYFHRLELHRYKLSTFLFSMKGFKPGTEPITSRKITDFFSEHVRDELGLDKEKTFYKGKHTGVTFLLNNIQSENAITAQVRHHSIVMTKSHYKAVDLKANEEIKQNSPPFTRTN